MEQMDKVIELTEVETPEQMQACLQDAINGLLKLVAGGKVHAYSLIVIGEFEDSNVGAFVHANTDNIHELLNSNRKMMVRAHEHLHPDHAADFSQMRVLPIDTSSDDLPDEVREFLRAMGIGAPTPTPKGKMN